MKLGYFYLLYCCTFALVSAAHAQVDRKRVCLSVAETREAVASHRLIEPSKALKTARAQARAELLASRLCRWNDEFVYEITLLKRSGRIVHVFMNAADGKAMSPTNTASPASPASQVSPKS